MIVGDMQTCMCVPCIHTQKTAQPEQSLTCHLSHARVHSKMNVCSKMHSFTRTCPNTENHTHQIHRRTDARTRTRRPSTGTTACCTTSHGSYADEPRSRRSSSSNGSSCCRQAHDPTADDARNGPGHAGSARAANDDRHAAARPSVHASNDYGDAGSSRTKGSSWRHPRICELLFALFFACAILVCLLTWFLF
jgi:hypothetical protein